MQNKVKIAFLCFAVLFLFKSGEALADNNIALPDPIVFKSNIIEVMSLFQIKCNVNGLLFPKQITFDIINKKISGIMAIYNNSISFSEFERVINENYSKWRIKSLDNTDVDIRVWRVDSMGIVIQLGRNNIGDIQLILMPFYDR